MIIKHPEDSDIPALRALWKQAFGDTDAYLDAFFETAFDKERCLCMEDAGKPAAALYWLNCSCSGEKIAYFYAVATAESHRGQGLCTRLMTGAHELLARQSYAGSILVPGSEELFRFYGKLGYETCAWQNRIFTAVGVYAAPLAQITPERYAQLRRKYLPEGSVAQEGENLAFARRLLQFYDGGTFLLAAAKEGSSLFAPELLGDSSAAPGILVSLGAPEGTFRAPGSETPFAMYRPISPAPAPRYFAFAFD